MDKAEQLKLRLEQNKIDQQRLEEERQRLEKELEQKEITFGLGDKKEKGKLNFYLEKCGNAILLRVRDRTGLSWNILRIWRNGTLSRYGSVADDIGLKTENGGRIKLA